ncbi:MAG TPA: hypothetical protein VNO22_17465 [Planctomycetota bacterium]|nr:hypothetical protein [Planctomycetota bacterium]
MMGLERLFRNLYGTTPQIDMDRQLARARVPDPRPLDFAGLAEGIRRNNVGTAAITVRATAEVGPDKVILRPTGQEFLLHGSAPADGGARPRRLRVHGWESPATVRLEILE